MLCNRQMIQDIGEYLICYMILGDDCFVATDKDIDVQLYRANIRLKFNILADLESKNH